MPQPGSPVPDPPPPEVSVVIVSYRCRDLLLDCLESLDAQRATCELEVIALDNDSGDGTASAARRAHPWAEVVELGENLGFAAANNVGIRRARAGTVLILNPDTVLPPGALRACLDELAADPRIGVLTPRLVDREGRLDRRCKRGFPTPWSSLCYFAGLDRVLTGPRSTAYTAGWLPEDRAGDVVSVSGAFMLMPTALVRRVGAFDEQFFMYAEDMDLCIRISETGHRVRYWPAVDVVHVGAGSNVRGHRPPAADAAYFRTMAPFLRKHRPGVRGRLLAGTVSLMAEACLLASRGRARLARAGGARRAERSPTS